MVVAAPTESYPLSAESVVASLRFGTTVLAARARFRVVATVVTSPSASSVAGLAAGRSVAWSLIVGVGFVVLRFRFVAVVSASPAASSELPAASVVAEVALRLRVAFVTVEVAASTDPDDASAIGRSRVARGVAFPVTLDFLFAAIFTAIAFSAATPASSTRASTTRIVDTPNKNSAKTTSAWSLMVVTN